MHWRLKAAFFWGFDLIPFGAKLHYYAQRRITRSLPRNIEPLAEHAASYMQHPIELAKLEPGFSKGRVLEFGAGRDLFGNFILWCCGIEHQTVIDITPLLKPELMNHVITTLQCNPLPGFIRRPTRMLSDRDYLSELREVYGIDYLAPADARSVDMPTGSIDLVLTTNTLEHIPEVEIAAILRECYRLCRDGGMLSHVIDYSDHYSHADSSRTPFSFLGYSDTAWRRYNPPNHFQNRMRHRDHRRLIEDAGFECVLDRSHIPEDGAKLLSCVQLHDRFTTYSRSELLPTSGHLIARKPSIADRLKL